MASGWQQINSGSAIVAAFLANADTFFEKVRASLEAVIFVTHVLGGSRSQAVSGTGYQDAADYLDFTVPNAASAGGTYEAVIDLLCENAATSLTPKIRNITDSSDAVVGSASTSTSWASQTLSFTPAAGKLYRLQLVKSDDLFKAFAIGYVRRKA